MYMYVQLMYDHDVFTFSATCTPKYSDTVALDSKYTPKCMIVKGTLSYHKNKPEFVVAISV